MKSKTDIRKKIESKYRYLIDDYGFKIVDHAVGPFGEQLTYENATSFVKVAVEPREGGASVYVGRLVDGEIPEYPIFINDETELHGYYLGNFVELRAEKAEREAENTGDSDKDLSRLARLLRTYGDDVLRGDFSSFSVLEKRVKQHARKIRAEN